MNISATVNQAIDRIPPGKIFGYEVFTEYQTKPEAVIRAVGRRVADAQLTRLSKGRFYIPKKGVLGEIGVSDGALLRDLLFRKGKRCGYITGAALYNRLGLTSQMPKTLEIAADRAPQTKDFGTIRIKYVPRQTPITEANVPLLEILDVLRDAKKVPDASTEDVIKMMRNQIVELETDKIQKMQNLAIGFYNAATRAVLGMILDRNTQEVLPALRKSINPTTRFDVGLDKGQWPSASVWNIR